MAMSTRSAEQLLDVPTTNTDDSSGSILRESSLADPSADRAGGDIGKLCRCVRREVLIAWVGLGKSTGDLVTHDLRDEGADVLLKLGHGAREVRPQPRRDQPTS